MITGACVGTVVPALTQLKLKWVYGVSANAMSDEFLALPEGIEFVPLTFENLPNETWSRFLGWGSYQGYWLIGSEPHTNWDGNKSVTEIAPIFMAQMDYIKAFDPNAKFIVTCSTQGQLPYNWHYPDENFIGDLWALFPSEYRDRVTGFHMHIYPRWSSGDLVKAWQVRTTVKYLRRMRLWMQQNNVLDKELWLSEVGFEEQFGPDNSASDYARCAEYLRKLLKNKNVNAWLTRLAFYVATPRANNDGGGSNNYLPLLNEIGELTTLGNVWNKGVQ